MIGFNTIGFMGFCFVGATLINRILEGQFITAVDVGILNTMSIWGKLEAGPFTVPVINISYLNGLFHLVKWDYSFFGGNAQIMQFFFYSITFALQVAIFLLILGMLYNVFGRAR